MIMPNLERDKLRLQVCNYFVFTFDTNWSETVQIKILSVPKISSSVQRTAFFEKPFTLTF